MRVLITGGAGFIGSTLAERRLAGGDEVVVLDNFHPFYDPAIKRENIRAALDHANYTLVEGDIRDREAVAAAVADGVDIIVHIAARAGVRDSILEPDEYFSVNLGGTIAILETIKPRLPRHFVFASTSSVYGDSETAPYREDQRCDRPLSPYAASKRAGEHLLYCYHHLTGLPVTCLRFFTVYGPRQRPEMAIHRFTREISRGQPITVFGDGTQQRDFTFIEDCVDGVERAMERPNGFQVYNLAAGRRVVLNDVIGLIEQALGKKAEMRYEPRHRADMRETWGDISRARQGLGYAPQTPIEDGIRRFVDWYRQVSEAGGGKW
jgi:UDP-glucuronate 4-epimerase